MSTKSSLSNISLRHREPRVPAVDPRSARFWKFSVIKDAIFARKYETCYGYRIYVDEPPYKIWPRSDHLVALKGGLSAPKGPKFGAQPLPNRRPGRVRDACKTGVHSSYIAYSKVSLVARLV